MSLEWGSSFVVDLRLQWLRLGARNVLPLTVQVLGDWDDMVIRDDALDAGVIGRFAIIPVAATGHYQMTKFDARRVGSIRRKAVVEALCSPERHLLEKRAYHPTPRADRAPDAVVLIAHGIRSTADWARRVGIEINRINPDFLVESASYGHLSILGFVFFPTRNRYVRWLADRYTENVLVALANMNSEARRLKISSYLERKRILPVDRKSVV